MGVHGRLIIVSIVSAAITIAAFFALLAFFGSAQFKENLADRLATASIMADSATYARVTDAPTTYPRARIFLPVLELPESPLDADGEMTPPSYPEGCKPERVNGTVIFSFDITLDGRPVNIRISDSPNECFNESILQYVESWRYKPASAEDEAPILRHHVTAMISFT